MRAALIALAAATTLCVPAAPAAAQTAADRSDVRCLLMMQLVAREPKNREQAAKAIFYYMGRLGGRGGIARVEPLMAAEARNINSAAVAKAELDRCGREVGQAQSQFQAINQRLAAAARPPAKK